MAHRKVTVLDIQNRKENHIPITMLTAYDYSGAALVDEAGIDMLLVGDSLGMVMLGRDNTISVTMDEMIHHCRAVANGAKSAFLVGDLPFLSYQPDEAEAVRNAGRILKESGMDAVKLEGGQELTATIKRIVAAGIPVMGHIGLTPQTLSRLGGYRVQGKSAVSASKLLTDALALQDAGCFAIVLEAIPASVAAEITNRLRIPTIGIGAGAECDGQVLVYHDLLGLIDQKNPRFVKQYVNLRAITLDAFAAFRSDVVEGRFPSAEHTYPMTAEEEAAFKELLSDGREQ